MAKVFIVQDNPYSPKNFIPASKYGQLVTCVRGHVSLASLDKCVIDLEDALEDVTRDDWLILTGHPALMGVACHLMADATGVIRTLIWDNQSAQYYPFVYDPVVATL